MRAAAINARDVMVIAHDPIYPIKNVDWLVPCADGAGEVEAVGEGSMYPTGRRRAGLLLIRCRCLGSGRPRPYYSF